MVRKCHLNWVLKGWVFRAHCREEVTFKVNFTGSLKGGEILWHFLESLKHRAKAVFNLVPFMGQNTVQE